MLHAEWSLLGPARHSLLHVDDRDGVEHPHGHERVSGPERASQPGCLGFAQKTQGVGVKGVISHLFAESIAPLPGARPERLAKPDPVDIAQRFGHGESSQLPPTAVAYDDEILDRRLGRNPRDHRALRLQVYDFSRCPELKVVMGGFRNRPQKSRISIELEEPEEFPDDDEIAIGKEQSAAPEVSPSLLRAFQSRVVGEDLGELGPPLVEHLAVHGQQERDGAMARGHQVQAGCASSGVVSGDASGVARGFARREVADCVQLLDLKGLARIGRSRVNRWIRRLGIRLRAEA